MKRPQLLSALSTFPLVALVGCGGLEATDQAVSLAPAINATVNLPSGGKVKATSGGAAVEWVGISFIAKFTLDDALATKRNAVARNFAGTFDGQVPVNLAGKAYTCGASAKKQADAERLMAVCDKLAADSPKAAASTSITSADASAAPLDLEERKFPVKAPLGKPFNVTARVPKGWATTEQLGTVLLKDPAPTSLDAISVTFGAYDGVKTLADAEREAKRADAAGLDTIGEKRELDPGKFLVATEPRGRLKLTTVRVFGRGKKGTVIATCSGPGSRKAALEQICGSAAAE